MVWTLKLNLDTTDIMQLLCSLPFHMLCPDCVSAVLFTPYNPLLVVTEYFAIRSIIRYYGCPNWGTSSLPTEENIASTSRTSPFLEDTQEGIFEGAQHLDKPHPHHGCNIGDEQEVK